MLVIPECMISKSWSNFTSNKGHPKGFFGQKTFGTLPGVAFLVLFFLMNDPQNLRVVSTHRNGTHTEKKPLPTGQK